MGGEWWEWSVESGKEEEMRRIFFYWQFQYISAEVCGFSRSSLCDSVLACFLSSSMKYACGTVRQITTQRQEYEFHRHHVLSSEACLWRIASSYI